MKALDELMAEYDAQNGVDECPACGGPCEFSSLKYPADESHEANRRAWLRAWLRGVQDDVIASASLACAQVPIGPADYSIEYERSDTVDLCCKAVCKLHEEPR